MASMFSICVCGRHVKDFDETCPFCGATERSNPRPGRATRRIAALAALGINACTTTVPVYGDFDDDDGPPPDQTTSSASGGITSASGVVTSSAASTGSGQSSSSGGGAGGSGEGGAGGN